MTESEIKEKLCIHDKRNPDFIEGYTKGNDGFCYCDNCFYGRSALAEEILKLTQALKLYERIDNKSTGRSEREV